MRYVGSSRSAFPSYARWAPETDARPPAPRDELAPSDPHTALGPVRGWDPPTNDPKDWPTPEPMRLRTLSMTEQREIMRAGRVPRTLSMTEQREIMSAGRVPPVVPERLGGRVPSLDEQWAMIRRLVR
jgi:hypothetical protein